MAARGLDGDEPRVQFHSPAEDDAITLSLSAMSGSLSMYVGVAFACAGGVVTVLCPRRAGLWWSYTPSMTTSPQVKTSSGPPSVVSKLYSFSPGTGSEAPACSFRVALPVLTSM